MDGFKRDENGKFAPGTAPGPGRPPGQSLKEFWRQRFARMTDEEKIAFTNKVGFDTIWRMAEGNPQNDVTTAGEKITVTNLSFDEYSSAPQLPPRQD